MKKLALAAAIALLLPIAAQAKPLKTYPSLAEAHRLCKTPVVWINTNSMIYHAEGTKNFGRTNDGAYTCQAAAKAAGGKMAKNGQ